MRREMMSGLGSTFMLTALVMGVVAGGAAHAVTVYSEDFNSYSNGGQITDAGWTAAGDGKLGILATPSSTPPLGFDTSGGWIDGRYQPDTSWQGGVNARKNVGYHNTGIWTYAADLKWAYPPFGGCSIYLWNSTFPTRNGQAIADHNEVAGSQVNYGAWTWGIGPGIELPGAWGYHGDASAYRAEIVMDFENYRHKATMTQLVADPYHTLPWSVSTGWIPFDTSSQVDIDRYFGFDTIGIYQAARGSSGNGYIMVDNIVLSNNEVPPAPGTLIILE